MWIYIYVGIIALALVVEFLTTDMLTIWFVGGGIISLILSSLGVEWYIHIPVFLLSSLVLILSFRKIVLRFLDKGDSKLNADAQFGKEVILLSSISFNKPGTIKVNDVIWTAVSENERDEISEGAIVRIKNLKGNKYVVEEVK